MSATPHAAGDPGAAPSDPGPADPGPTGPGPSVHYGGQAVPEGVMMRGADRWAVAVRRPRGDIWLECHAIPGAGTRHPVLRWPVLRGGAMLADSLGIGMRALGIAAERSAPEPVEDGEDPIVPPIGAALALAASLFVVLFVVLPAALTVVLDVVTGGVLRDSIAFDLVDALARIAVFVGYLLSVSRVRDIRRVFQYHGAEHKTIAAWEHGEPLEPAAVDRYSTVHVRCGTNFLALVMLLSTVLFTVASVAVRPGPGAGWLATFAVAVAVRVVLLPLVAGLAYEGLRIGAAHGDVLPVRLVMRPGLWLQRITTQPPTADQLEIAIRSFEAVVPAQAREGRGPTGLTSVVTVAADGLPVDLHDATVVRDGASDPAAPLDGA